MKKHIEISIKGKVQGVYFRDSTKAVADQLSIAGFVQNQPDGTVYIGAEGDEYSLNELIAWCKKGPERAQVTDVYVTEGEVVNYVDFVVKKKKLFGF